MGRFNHLFRRLEKIFHVKVNRGCAEIVATVLLADCTSGKNAGKETPAGGDSFKAGDVDAQEAYKNGFRPDPAGVEEDVIGGAIDGAVYAVDVIIADENAKRAVTESFP